MDVFQILLIALLSALVLQPLVRLWKVLEGNRFLIRYFNRKQKVALEKRSKEIDQSLNKDIQASFERKTVSSNPTIKAVEFVSIDMNNTRIHKKSVNSYFDTIKSYVQSAEKEILIFDYLPKIDLVQHLYESEDEGAKKEAKFLGDKYRDYFKIIEDKIQQGVEYKRIFQLPHIDLFKHGIHADLSDSGFKAFVTKKVAEIATREKIYHVKRLFESGSEKVEIYNLPYSKVKYGYMVIDGKFVLSEYYSFDEKDVAYIDELYVNKASSIKDQVLLRRNRILEQCNNLNRVKESDFQEAIKRTLDEQTKILKEAKKRFEIMN